MILPRNRLFSATCFNKHLSVFLPSTWCWKLPNKTSILSVFLSFFLLFSQKYFFKLSFLFFFLFVCLTLCPCQVWCSATLPDDASPIYCRPSDLQDSNSSSPCYYEDFIKGKTHSCSWRSWRLPSIWALGFSGVMLMFGPILQGSGAQGTTFTVVVPSGFVDVPVLEMTRSLRLFQKSLWMFCSCFFKLVASLGFPLDVDVNASRSLWRWIRLPWRLAWLLLSLLSWVLIRHFGDPERIPCFYRTWNMFDWKCGLPCFAIGRKKWLLFIALSL